MHAHRLSARAMHSEAAISFFIALTSLIIFVIMTLRGAKMFLKVKKDAPCASFFAYFMFYQVPR